jgi:hypothetical protein
MVWGIRLEGNVENRPAEYSWAQTCRWNPWLQVDSVVAHHSVSRRKARARMMGTRRKLRQALCIVRILDRCMFTCVCCC